MMTRRPHIAKSIFGLAADHHVRGPDHRPGRMQRGGEGMRVHRGIRIHMEEPSVWRRARYGVDIAGLMHPQQLLSQGLWGDLNDEMLNQPGCEQMVLNRRQPVG